MTAKAFFVLCASAVFLQTISGQCIGSALNYGIGGVGCSCGAAPISVSGGGLAVVTTSPIAPNGISVVSQNNIEGCLDVTGQLPLLAAVGLEGVLPTAGSAGVSYSCGNGQVGIASQGLGAAGYGAGYGFNPAGLINEYAGQIGLSNAGIYGLNGIGGCGCGC